MLRPFVLALALILGSSSFIVAQVPMASKTLVFAEKDGIVAVEAEHFVRQSATESRAFYLTHPNATPEARPDGDPSHVAGASGGAYLEILPDTRRTHDDKLIKETNFAPEPGKMAIVSYPVRFQTPGRYYVWVRAYSTGTEDNGLHVGLNGEWPESGQRLQWCQGKNQWRWESRQRTEKEHCGEPHKIYLDIPSAGLHTIEFSMREDGFEFDKWLMTTDRDFKRPTDEGPDSIVHAGKRPPAFSTAVASPKLLTKADDASASSVDEPSLVMSAAMFNDGKVSGYYFDRKKWMAVDPEENQEGSAERTFPYPTGIYHVTLQAIGENDGASRYTVYVDGEIIGQSVCPLAEKTYEGGPKYHQTWKNVSITEGAIIGVASKVASNDGEEFSRARWSQVTFEPADDTTRDAAKPYVEEQATVSSSKVETFPKGSPTVPVSDALLQTPRRTNGNGDVSVQGEPMVWHKITLDLQGPYAHEKDNSPNPFTDYCMNVTFTHAGESIQYTVPGYFAADGKAVNTSAESGTVWRAHFAPDRPGRWNYTISFSRGKNAALDADTSAESLPTFDGQSGTIEVAPSDKTGRDLRAQGRLQYVGTHYLRFAGSGKYFLKVGADAPETLLAYADFDNTIAGNAKKAPLKTWSAHEQDWNPGDPTWKEGRGKGLIGAINYLSGKGCNAFSFLTYNAGGDGDNVWPFIHRDDKLHYDCSKLDQWSTVFDHGTARGMYLHFKMQETENDDHDRGTKRGGGRVRESLDGGDLGIQRKLYCRELVARFGHNLALNWNLGEENTQTTQQVQAMIDYIAELDAYDHNIVIHTFPNQQDKVYDPLLGDQSRLTGVSLQNSSLETTHSDTVRWVEKSARAGKPWIVAFDESGSAAHAQCPDLGYKGFDGRDRTGKMAYTEHKVRKQTLWATLMAGGAGCEYYFGYQFDQNDIVCEDWRSRDRSWDYCRIAIEFFHDHSIPFWEMTNADALVGNADHKPTTFCFAKPNELYLVYIPDGDDTDLDLTGVKGMFDVRWFNPRVGGGLRSGSVTQVSGGTAVSLGSPPAGEDKDEDWLVVIQK